MNCDSDHAVTTCPVSVARACSSRELAGTGSRTSSRSPFPRSSTTHFRSSGCGRTRWRSSAVAPSTTARCTRRARGAACSARRDTRQTSSRCSSFRLTDLKVTGSTAASPPCVNSTTSCGVATWWQLGGQTAASPPGGNWTARLQCRHLVSTRRLAAVSPPGGNWAARLRRRHLVATGRPDCSVATWWQLDGQTAASPPCGNSTTSCGVATWWRLGGQTAASPPGGNWTARLQCCHLVATGWPDCGVATWWQLDSQTAVSPPGGNSTARLQCRHQNWTPDCCVATWWQLDDRMQYCHLVATAQISLHTHVSATELNYFSLCNFNKIFLL